MAIPKGQSDEYRDIRRKIAEHGMEEVETIIDLPGGQQKTIVASRILIALEMLFGKLSNEKNLAAAQQYLDRMLGKPKESLSISDDSEGIGKLTDDQLIEKIAAAVKQAAKAGAGESD